MIQFFAAEDYLEKKLLAVLEANRKYALQNDWLRTVNTQLRKERNLIASNKINKLEAQNKKLKHSIHKAYNKYIKPAQAELYKKDWNSIWNAQEDELLRNGDSWTADYSEGVDKEFIHKTSEGVEFYMRHNKYWINDRTGERITRQEFERRQELKYPKRDLASQVTLESARMDFLDFGKTNM